ncbi:hypothetical protein PsorP6_005648 [Peronosclerospora sorghi]|uniref:Uncharacterized protein n=1 Tax=Peronosclerospora sorghi TaxID=230839 RepID=A0ACC0W1Y0_9STRA|nr:hypothetical protein PsorP6_005648 [Peronosclerospora sorghi]
MASEAKSSGVWLMSCSSLSLSLSPDSLSLSRRSPDCTSEIQPTHSVVFQSSAAAPHSRACVLAERQEFTIYGLEPDGALRPGGPVPLVSRATVGLLLNYMAIGALCAGINSAIAPALSNYLQLPPYQVRAASSVVNTAWNFKFVGGLVTDNVRIGRYRRKPYLVLGWLLCIVSLLYLGTSQVPLVDTPPLLAWRYVLCLTLGTTGYFLANAAADAFVVDMAQREPLATRGYTQASICMARVFGAIVMSLFVTATLNGSGHEPRLWWSIRLHHVMLVLAAFAVLPLLGSIWFLHEGPTVPTVPLLTFSSALACHGAPHQAPTLTFADRWQLTWRLLQSRAMWQVLMFELIANICWSMDTTAKTAIEVDWFNVQTWPKAVAGAVWSVAYIGGFYFARCFLLRNEWRHLCCVATLWSVFVDVLTVACTVFNVLRHRYFWLYMQVLAAPALALRFLVLIFPIVELAPRGIESTTYGLVVTFRTIAVPLATSAYKAMDSYFALSDDHVRRDLPSTRSHICYTFGIGWAFQLVSLGLLGLLPRQKLEVHQLRYFGGYSIRSGWFIVFLLVSLILLVTTANVLSLFESTSCLFIAGGSGCKR